MLNLVALGLNILSLILNIVGLAIPYWQYLAVGEGKTYAGLWQFCIDPNPLGDKCATYPAAQVTDALKATRAMELLGMIIILGALVCAILSVSVMKSQTLLPKVAGGCAIAAAVFMIIGAIIYAAKVKVEGLDLHAGFALCIVAGVLAIVAGILYLIFKKND